MKDYFRVLLKNITRNDTVRNLLREYALKGVLPGMLWKRLPVEADFSLLGPDGQNFFYSAIANDRIGRYLFWRGLQGHEPETVKIFYEIAKKSNVVLDVGANTGLFTLIACIACNSSRVIAFEPVPKIYDRLVKNIEVNGWEKRCSLYPTAVSNYVGFTPLHIPISNSRQLEMLPSSASMKVEGFRNYKGNLIQVPVTTIDTICAKGNEVNLVKIDVEGFEDSVLEGMDIIMNTYVPKIIIECNPDGPYQKVEKILRQYDYRFFHICQHGLVPNDVIIPDKNEKYRNYLCVSRNADNVQFLDGI
jgi:FkbM family methyltransferase